MAAACLQTTPATLDADITYCTGKTVFVEKLIKANPSFKFVVVICRRSLADELGSRLPGNVPGTTSEFTNYRDIPESGMACSNVNFQAESFYQLETTFYGGKVILVLDEFSSLCEQMTSHTKMRDKHEYNIRRASPQRIRQFARVRVIVECPALELIRDVRTRWNSTNAMLRDAYQSMCRSEPHLEAYVLDEDE
ncbi:hypothetical protein BGX28_005431 [Mortierella sp. GBA30]|nr:hypothetical protein BGX28_005431 [Mortierella sp. GBA30]